LKSFLFFYFRTVCFKRLLIPQEHSLLTFSASGGCRFAGISQLPHGLFQTGAYSAGTQPSHFFCFGRVPLRRDFRSSPHGLFQTAAYSEGT
jgi:hypothetical protein